MCGIVPATCHLQRSRLNDAKKGDSDPSESSSASRLFFFALLRVAQEVRGLSLACCSFSLSLYSLPATHFGGCKISHTHFFLPCQFQNKTNTISSATYATYSENSGPLLLALNLNMYALLAAMSCILL